MLKFKMEETHKENKFVSLCKGIAGKLKPKRQKDSISGPLQVVRGRFSLAGIRGCQFPGRQSAATALCALLQAKCLSPSSWSPQVLDRLLLQGDKLHTTRLHHLGILANGGESLSPQHLPTNFSSVGNLFSLELNSPSTSTKSDDEAQHPRDYLKETLSYIKDGALVTCHGNTLAVILDGNFFYIFNPTPKKTKSTEKKTRKSSLLKFYNLDNCVDHMTKLLEENSIQALSVLYVEINVHKL